MVEDAKEFVIGMCLSAITWETFENLLVAMTVAFLGGLMGAAGKQAHRKFLTWREKRNGQHRTIIEDKEDNDQNQPKIHNR